MHGVELVEVCELKFSGRLQIEADPRNWLKTELDLSQGRLQLVSGGELLGSWTTGQVKAERLEGDRFQLQLGADRAVFAADDALAFSYEALPALAKKSVLAAATGLRGKLRKGVSGPDRAPQPESEVTPVGNHMAPEPEVRYLEDPPLSSSLSSPPTRRLRELIQEAVRNNTEEAAVHGQSTHWERPPTPPVAQEEPLDIPEVDAWSDPPPLADVEDPPGPTPPAKLGGWFAALSPVVPDAVPDAAEAAVSAADEVDMDETTEIPPAIQLVPASPRPAFTPMIDRVGPLRPLFEIERSLLANGDDSDGWPPEPPPRISPTAGVLGAPIRSAGPLAELAPPRRLLRTLDTLIEEVKNGEMSPVQIVAVTDLIRAVAEAIEAKK